jgi:calcium/calmodulin-dependent protein kinase I
MVNPNPQKDVLKRISQGHKSILNLWDFFETPNNLYLVMDLCTGGELFDRYPLLLS